LSCTFYYAVFYYFKRNFLLHALCSQNAVGQHQLYRANAQSPTSDPTSWKMEVVTPPAGGTTSCCNCSCNKEKKSSQRK